jgi:ParB-like chromosome segregation protein Spo0J
VATDKGRKAVEKKARTLQRLTVEYVPTDSLRPNDYNPNRQSEHDFELLLRSMREDGFTQPIIVQPDLTIVDGEHRWRAARTLGLAEVPVVKVDMTPEQMRIATLRHNRARGSEDVELTAQLLRDLRELGALDWAADSLLLDDVELQRLLDDIPAPEALAAPEFSDAWVPLGTRYGREDQQGEVQPQRIEGVTPAAADILRERERRLAEAKTEEERQMIAAERRDLYRVALTFTDTEAKIVREVLGDRPAQRLLDLCKAELARRTIPAE